MSNFFATSFEATKQALSSQLLPFGRSNWNLYTTSDYWLAKSTDLSYEFEFFHIAILAIILTSLSIWLALTIFKNRQLKVYKDLIDHLINMIIYVLVFYIFYILVRSQSIIYLSSPMTLIFAMLVLLVWLGFVIYRSRVIIPRKITEHLEKERFFRYLPKSRKGAN